MGDWKHIRVPEQGDRVTFEADILHDGTPIARVIKSYELPAGTYDMKMRLAVQNLTAKPPATRTSGRPYQYPSLTMSQRFAGPRRVGISINPRLRRPAPIARHSDIAPESPQLPVRQRSARPSVSSRSRLS